MNKLLFILFTLIFSYSPSFAQGNMKVRPTYLAYVLIDQPSEEKMKSICEYYKLTELPSEGDYQVFQHTGGIVLKFKLDKVDDKSFPEVKILSKESQGSISKALINAGFDSTNDGYVKGSKFEHRRTRCRISGHTQKTLTFTKEYKAEE